MSNPGVTPLIASDILLCTKYFLNLLPSSFVETVLQQQLESPTIYLCYWSVRGLMFPLASGGDSPQSQPAPEVCGPTSTPILISRLLFLP